jgi:hypothetical protein
VAATPQGEVHGYPGEERGHGQEEGATGARGGQHPRDEQRANREAGVAAGGAHAHRLLAVAAGRRGAPLRPRVKRRHPDPDSAIASQVSG